MARGRTVLTGGERHDPAARAAVVPGGEGLDVVPPWREMGPATVGPAIAATVGSVASRTFELDGFKRPFAVVLCLVLAPGGIVLLLIGDGGGQAALAVLFMAAGGFGVFEWGFWAPHRVTLDDSGVLLEASLGGSASPGTTSSRSSQLRGTSAAKRSGGGAVVVAPSRR